MSGTIRTTTRRGGRVAVTLVAVLATSMIAVGTAGPAGAHARTADKADKAAVLRFGVPFEDQGGPFFDPQSPRASANPTPRIWLDLIYGTMIVDTVDGKGAPGLATEWSAPDARTVDVTLREGVKFSDGTRFDADAVVAAWTNLINGNRPNKSTDIEAMTSVEKVADNKVRIHLDQPVAANFLNDHLKNATHLGVPSPTAAAKQDLDAAPVGAGPYALKSYATGKVVLEKNPTYYDRKMQKLAGVEFDDVPIGPAGVSALQSGTVDAIWNFPPDAVQTIESSPGLQVFAAPSESQYQLALCPTQGVFANEKARQALQYAIDRSSIDEAALSGTGAPSTLVLPPNSPYFDKKLAKTVTYDTKKAKALLKDAGVAEGTKVSILVPSQPPYDAIADVVQGQLEAVGLAPQITKTTSYASDAARIKPDMATVSLSPNLFSLVFQGENPLNFCNWNDPEMIAALDATRDPNQSEAALTQAWAKLQETALAKSANIVTNQQGTLVGMTDKVKGLTIVHAPYGPQLYGVSMTK